MAVILLRNSEPLTEERFGERLRYVKDFSGVLTRDVLHRRVVARVIGVLEKVFRGETDGGGPIDVVRGALEAVDGWQLVGYTVGELCSGPGSDPAESRAAFAALMRYMRGEGAVVVLR